MPTRLLIIADNAEDSALTSLADSECAVLTGEDAIGEINAAAKRSTWTHLIRFHESESVSSRAVSELLNRALITGAGITYGVAASMDGGARAVPVSRLRHALRVWNPIPFTSIFSRDAWYAMRGLAPYCFERTAWWDIAIRGAHSDIAIEFCENAVIRKNESLQNTESLPQWRDLATLICENPDAFERQQRLWADLLARDSHQGLAPQECLSLLDLSFPRLLDWQQWYTAAFSLAQLRQQSAMPTLSASGQMEWMRIVSRLRAFGGRLNFQRDSRASTPGIKRKASPVFGIDIRPLSIPSTRNRGIGRYVISTLRAMLELNADARFVLLGEEDTLDSAGIEDIAAHPQVAYRCYARGCDEDLDCFLLTDPSPVMRGRHTKALPIHKCPWGSIVYDLIPLEFPEQYLASDKELLDDYLDNLQTLTQRCKAFFPISDYVGNELQHRLSIPASEIIPIYGGNWPSAGTERAQRTTDAPYFLYVGGADARKNLNRLIAAFAKFCSETDSSAKLLLVGEMNRDKTLARLSGLRLAHLSERIVGLGGVDDKALEELYANAEATVFVSLSEGLGLPALEAMSCDCPVIGSNNSALGETIGDAGLLVNPYSITEICEAMKSIVCSPELRSDLIQKGRARAAEWTWNKVARTLLDELKKLSWVSASVVPQTRKLHVAMLNRLNVWSAPGGDGEVMKQMRKAAALRDVSITFQEDLTQGSMPDVVHFVNLTLAKRLNDVAAEASSKDLPLVLTTLFEDWPSYMQTSHEVSAILMEYSHGKLSSSECESLLSRRDSTSSLPHAGSPTAVNFAAALLACGESEAARLAEVYPSAKDRIHVVPFAVRQIAEFEPAGVEQICKKLGMERFVLCCGRLETRKNQLMLLKALEDSDVGVVLAAGGYTPQPAYAEAVRCFKRSGKTIVLGRLERKSLDGLMRAASAHALPSFYELPGLVHLETAAADIPVAAATWGALTDYLPAHLIHPCEPDNPKSVRDAINRALNSAPNRATGDYARAFTLERLADNLLRVYESVLAAGHGTKKHTQSKKQNKSYLPSERGEIHALC
ncbi:glycosyltransferase [bacterium]|nr:glycosyltransferase [bacterium]